jgi:prolyl-tRNA synthetase
VELAPIEEAERMAGAKSGFIGPIDLGVPTYVDRSLEGAFNLTCGANQDGYHHFGFKPDRDLPQFKGFFDLRMAREGDRCTRCATGHYESYRGIEVGQVFKLGTKYSTAMSCMFLDENGREHPMVMGCYGIGITRTIAAVIEAELRCRRHHLAVAGGALPCAHRVSRPRERGDQRGRQRDRATTRASGIEVLHDDRVGLSPGVRFKDADLLGMPLRLTVGAKGLKDGIVELRDRRTKDVQRLTPQDVLEAVNKAGERWR